MTLSPYPFFFHPDACPPGIAMRWLAESLLSRSRSGLASFHGNCCIEVLPMPSRARELPMDETEESISMDDLRRGCPNAWNQAYPLLYRALVGTLQRELNPGPGVDLENIASDLIADEILEDFLGGNGAFFKANDFTHLLRIARKAAYFRAIDAIRRSGRRKETSLPENWEEFLEGSRGDHFQTGEKRATFGTLISILKPPKPEIFVDRFIEDLSYEEIAQKRGISTGVVGSHLSRGMKQIRKFLEEGQLPED